MSAIFRGARTVVVGVLNATPDSFSDGGRFVRGVAEVGLGRAVDLAAARARAELVVAHARGTPETMQVAPHYEAVVGEVAAELRASLAIARAAGVGEGSLAIDPGIGFGKRPEDNHALLVGIGALRAAVGG